MPDNRGDNLLNKDTILLCSKWICFFLLLLPFAASAETTLSSRVIVVPDSIVWRDSLRPAMLPIDHRPVRLEAGFGAFKGWYSSHDLPQELNLYQCDYFNHGSGQYMEGEVSLELPLWGDFSRWQFLPAVAFSSIAPHFTWSQQIKGRPENSTQLITSTITHEIDASITSVELRGLFTYDLGGSFSLRAGSALFRAVLNSSYEKRLHADSAGFGFRNGTLDTTLSSGSLPDVPVFAPTAILGLSFERPLSNSVRAQVFVQSTIDLFGPTSYWHGFTAEVGLRLAFDLTPRREWVPSFIRTRYQEIIPTKVDTPVVVQTTPVPDTVSPIEASIQAFSVSPDGKEAKVVRMTIEEVRTRNAVPLLNYIFFDDGSSSLASRYHQFASAEDASSNFQGSKERENIALLDLYHDCLNILGDRLQTYKSSKVTLIGCTSNSGKEAGHIALAKERAETIKEYLVRIWKIDPERIHTEGRLTPQKPSPFSTAEGLAENRRVEYVVQDTRVVDPVAIINSEHLATPDKIRLRPFIKAPAGILSSSASITAGGSPLRTFKGDSHGFDPSQTWDPTEEMLAGMKDSLGLELHVTDSAQHHKDVYGSVPLEVRHIRSDRIERVERFNLILFGFDEANIDNRNARMLAGLAKKLRDLKPMSITIYGYTDETGDPQHNIKLSKDRADQVLIGLEEAARKEGIELPRNIVTDGRGSQSLLYNNRLPEGRFYSRTVTITVLKESK